MAKLTNWILKQEEKGHSITNGMPVFSVVSWRDNEIDDETGEEIQSGFESVNYYLSEDKAGEDMTNSDGVCSNLYEYELSVKPGYFGRHFELKNENLLESVW